MTKSYSAVVVLEPTDLDKVMAIGMQNILLMVHLRMSDLLAHLFNGDIWYDWYLKQTNQQRLRKSTGTERLPKSV